MISEEKKKVLELFTEGRKLYKLMKFKEAKSVFEEALKIDPNDGPSDLYYKRCWHYLKHPPNPDWDGVFEMKTK